MVLSQILIRFSTHDYRAENSNPNYVPKSPSERAFRNGRQEAGNGKPYSRPENLGSTVFARTATAIGVESVKDNLRDWMLKQLQGE